VKLIEYREAVPSVGCIGRERYGLRNAWDEFMVIYSFYSSGVLVFYGLGVSGSIHGGVAGVNMRA
jgi:hypothetical protein